MRKLFLLLLSVLSVATGAFSQDLSNGYYRVTNAASDRYIHVLDNTGSINVQATTADMGAIVLKKGIGRAVSDPASVLYLEKHDAQYDIQAQNTGIFSILGVYVNLTKSPTVQNAYMAYGKKGSMVMYLYDAKSNMDDEESYLATKGSSRDWFINPIDNSTENYFGVQPTHQAGGKYYASFYASFPFSFASSGMKAYYITKVDENQGVAVYKEISGTIPALTPVIIECSSDNPANNKLNIGGSGSTPSGNLGKGVLFDLHKYKHDNFVTYNKSTMRTIGLAPDGSLAMTAGDYTDVPKNTFYVQVSASCPSSLKLVHESQYQEGPIEATAITLSQTELSLDEGTWTQIQATVTPDNATDKTVTWTSSNPSVATVDNWGTVRAISAGTAILTASCGNVSASCNVTVISTTVEATGITLSDTSLSLTIGSWHQVQATVTPDNATDKTVTWTSSNPSVATVDNWGTVRAIAAGTATVTASCGNVSASCTVTVANIEATAITLSDISLSINIGGWHQIQATVTPDNATDKTVTWSSSDPSVATVDKWGTVRAIAVGTATVTASCGNVSASCAVTVTPVEATSVELSSILLDLVPGESTTLTATVAPDNTTDKTVTWSTSDPSVATVDAHGTVTAVAPGSAVITAACGEAKGVCSVTVTAVEATSIELSATTMQINIGEQSSISAKVLPDNTTDKTVTWSSSDPSVATVDDNGTVTGVAEGTTSIIATCGSVTATCILTVTPIKAESISLNLTTLTLYAGDTETLLATILPAEVADKSVKWSSSDISVAEVSVNGVVTAIAPGSATVSAEVDGIVAECTVTVLAVEAESITLNAYDVEITVPETYQLIATVNPDNTTDKTVTWTSSNPAVATVEADGLVKTVAEGTVVITATCGNAQAECKVKVNPLDGIHDITADGEAFDVYNIQGIMLLQQVTSLEGLPHGFYIVNGHTVRH